MRRVIARAYANIALCKYWGKIPGGENLPATPSISLALSGLKTETIVETLDHGPDSFRLDGHKPDKNTANRLKKYLDYWRKQNLIKGHFAVISKNYFPTASGLASSSSGYAALVKALSEFSSKKISDSNLSRLARIGSGSAARSVSGGLSALPIGKDACARLILSPDEIPWGMIVVIVKADEKEIGSRQGMELSRKGSPYYQSWLSQAARDYNSMLAAIRKKDLSKIGEICEANTLAMHSCMMATRPALIYWNNSTLELIKAVKRWRGKGLEAYFTIDAGPHVIILAKREDLNSIAARARRIEGVISARISLPAGGAEVRENA
jgi:diphosphomevalonate decarboxylase